MSDYGMFTKAGNAVVAKIVVGALSLPITTTDRELYKYLSERMNKAQDKHPEIWDTAVRDAMISIIERKTNRDLSIYF